MFKIIHWYGHNGLLNVLSKSKGIDETQIYYNLGFKLYGKGNALVDISLAK